MDRRAFIGSLALLAAPFAAEGQQAGKVWRVGWLSPASAENGVPNLDALRQGLRELGYTEGPNVRFEVRWADSNTDRLPTLAAELVRLNVDLKRLCSRATRRSRRTVRGSHVGVFPA